MLVYILAVTFPLLVEQLYRGTVRKNYLKNKMWANRKSLKNYILLAALPMFFLIAFRNQNIGADTSVYIKFFNQIKDIPWDELFENTRLEPGYLVFVKIITLFTKSPLVFQIIYTSVYFFAIISFLTHIEKDHFFILFLFGSLGLYTFMFTGVRQCLAISVCLFSFRFIKDRKLVPFLLLMLLAFSFHKSAVLFVVAYFVYSLNLSYKSILLYIATTVLSVVYLENLQEFANEQLDYDYGIESNTGGIIFAIIALVMTAFTIYVTVKNKSITIESKGLINVGIIATFFWILRLFTRVAERPSFYFLLFLFAAFAYAISTIKGSNERFIVKCVTFVLSLALYIYKFTVNFSSFIPYSFYSF